MCTTAMAPRPASGTPCPAWPRTPLRRPTARACRSFPCGSPGWTAMMQRTSSLQGHCFALLPWQIMENQASMLLHAVLKICGLAIVHIRWAEGKALDMMWCTCSVQGVGRSPSGALYPGSGATADNRALQVSHSSTSLSFIAPHLAEAHQLAACAACMEHQWIRGLVSIETFHIA